MSHDRLMTGSAAPSRVDRRLNAIIGYVVALRGDFRDGRGTFNGDSLERIVHLGNASVKGLRSNWSHGNLCSDSLGDHLGRARNFRLAVGKQDNGEPVPAVRADLFFDPVAMKTPPRGGGRPMGDYLMELTENDASALASSLVLKVLKIDQLDDKGKKKVDEKGDPLPPIWLPRALTNSDLVAVGAATAGLLSPDPFGALTSLLDAPASRSLPNDVVTAGSALLDKLFAGRDRDDVAARIDQFKASYLTRRFGG
jgi:hypothetical protein